MYMKKYASLLLRIGLGGLFLTAGIMKLLDPGMFVEMLSSMGFPMAAVFAWIVIVVEILGGAAVVAGFKLKWAVPPLAFILLVAVGLGAGGFGIVLNNIVFILCLAALWCMDPGMWSIKA
jgi:uncharacterized membrane protein YphA (DoxX/SURF4 family)